MARRVGVVGSAELIGVLAVAAAMAGCGRMPLRGADGSGGDVVATGSSTAGAGGAATGAGGVTAGGGPDAGDATIGPAGWVEVSAPPEAAGAVVVDAWAVGPDDLYFASELKAPASASPILVRLLRYARGAWTVELSLTPPAGWSRPSVHGTAADDVWLVNGADLWHRDGSGWSRVADDGWRVSIPPPRYQPTGVPVFSRVRAAGKDDVWAVGVQNNDYTGGTGFILHRVSGASRVTILDDAGPPTIYYDYSDIFVAAPNDVWISGGSDEVGSTMDPAFVYHYDGATWSIHGYSRYTLPSLWPTGDGGFWVSSPDNPDVSADGGPPPSITLAKFDGTHFQGVEVAGLMSFNRLTALWGAGPDEVWATGDDVARWDGQSWRVVEDAPVATRPRTQDGGTFVTGDGTSVWLVAAGPRFFRLAR